MKLPQFTLRNIRRHRAGFFFSVVGIVLGTSSFVVFLALGQGLRKNVLERVYVANQIEVVPRRYQVGAFQGTGSLFGGGTGLDDFTVEDLRNAPGVVAVYPKMQLSFPGIIYGGEELFGRSFWTELIGDGVPPELIAQELPPPSDPANAFRDWDGETFTCEEPDPDRVGPEAGCPHGRFCNEERVCERLACTPHDEILATGSSQDAIQIRDLLGQRMRRQRPRGQVREVPEALRLSEDEPGFRVAVVRAAVDPARRLLPRLLLEVASRERVGIALDYARSGLPIPGEAPDEAAPEDDEGGTGEADAGLAYAPDPEGPATPSEWVILDPAAGACDDPPSYCPIDTRHCEMPIPVVASTFLLELYNTNIQTVLSGSDRDMPQLSPDALVGFTINADLGRGVLGEAVRLGEVGMAHRQMRLVGWSPRAMRLGATMPIDYVKRLNRRFKGEEGDDEYHSILVVADQTDDLAGIVKYVEDELQLAIGPEYEQSKRGSMLITLLTIGLLLISGLIILLAALNIMHTFLMLLAERRREIGVLRAVGARRLHITAMVLAESGVIGLVGAALGSGLALLAAYLADEAMVTYVPDFPFKPDSLFAFTPEIFLAALAVAILFSLLGAFIPAYRAAIMDPAEALRSE